MSQSDLTELTASEALHLLNTGELTCVEYVTHLIEWALKNEDLNVFTHFDQETILSEAHKSDEIRNSGKPIGKLHGLPLIIKDNIYTKDLHTAAACPVLKDFRPKNNAPALQKLLDEGAIIFGKANMHELACGITSNNKTFKPVRNPYDKTKIAGGSSGGTAAAVASRIVPLGLGTDTSGSSRIPPALCGVVGFRPTMNRYSAEGVIPLCSSRDTIGPIGRTVQDEMLLDSIMANHQDPINENIHSDQSSPIQFRIGIDRKTFFTNLDPETHRVVEEAIEKMRSNGVDIIEASIEPLRDLVSKVGFPIFGYEVLDCLKKFLHDTDQGSLEDLISGISSPDVKSTLLDMINRREKIEATYSDAVNVYKPQLQELYKTYFESNKVDAIMFPTTPLPARPIGEDSKVILNGVSVSTVTTYLMNTDPASNAGIPGVTIPVGLTVDNLPVGMELDGPAGSDNKLLQIALVLQSIIDPLPKP